MTGVAISYTIGSVIGFIISIVVAKRIQLLLSWKPLALTLFLPLALAFLFATLHVNYVIGIISTIIVSYLILMKLHVIEKRDGSFLLELLPDKLSNSLVTMSSKIEKIIDWFYG